MSDRRPSAAKRAGAVLAGLAMNPFCAWAGARLAIGAPSRTLDPIPRSA